MPQKKYDLTSGERKFEKDFKTEEDRQKRLDQIVRADYDQRRMPKKYKLPTFDCPACHAKNIMFAGDAVAKNETVLSLLEENGIADYVIICPKCKQYIGVRRHVGTELVYRQFRSLAPHVRFEYVYVFNHRVTEVYQENLLPQGALVFEGVINNEIGEKQEEAKEIHCVISPNKPRPRSRFEYAPSYYERIRKYKENQIK